MKKHLSFLAISISLMCLMSTKVHSQQPIAAIELPEYNLLYRGYTNKIIPAVSNNNGGTMLLTSEDVTIKKSDDGIHYFLETVSKKRTVCISFNLINGNDTTFVRRVEFRLYNLPDPSLYWGPAKEGGHANIREHKLFVKYPPEIPLNAEFRVVKWEVCVDSIFVKGKGGSIKDAESILKKVDKASNVSIIVTFVGPDGIHRKKMAIWKVEAWDETEEPQELGIECGG
jgi:hypothetical protein